MEHKWMRLFKDGKWTGRPDRMLVLSDGKEHSIDDLAKQHGLTLPDNGSHKPKKHKKEINIDIEEPRHEDLESAFSTGDPEEHDGGDSQSEE